MQPSLCVSNSSLPNQLSTKCCVVFLGRKAGEVTCFNNNKHYHSAHTSILSLVDMTAVQTDIPHWSSMCLLGERGDLCCGSLFVYFDSVIPGNHD